MQNRIIISAVLGLMASYASATPSNVNMTRGVTDISQRVYDLHMTILIICCVIGVVVFGVMFYAIIKHRKSKGAVAAQFHESTKVEIIWTVIPFLILIGMAIPATKTLIEMEDNSNSDITIKITGSQWKWHYEYFDHDFGFYSLLATPPEQFDNRDGKNLDVEKGEHYLLEVDKPLVLPIGKKVRFLVTADDVIHSWWVPAFAVKQDANPGFINEAWTIINEPGIYRGQCAELCGKDHGYMPVVVKAVTQDEYDVWIAQQKQQVAQAKLDAEKALASTLTMEESMKIGEQIYISRCAACHQPNGMGIPSVFPALKNSPMVLNDKAAHIDMVVNGRAGTAMQAFANQLTAKELAAVITYERNAWGNNTGEVIQVSEVDAVKGAK